MTITDAMVAEACRAVHGWQWGHAQAQTMRAVLEAACSELMRENEALRAKLTKYHFEEEIWDKGNG